MPLPASGTTCTSYADAYVPILIQRCKNVLVVLFAFSVLFAVVPQAHFCVFSWKTLFYACILYFSVIPIFAIRLIGNTVYQPVLPSAAAEVVAIVTRKDYWYTVGFYCVSSLVIIRSYFSLILDGTYTSMMLMHPQGQRFGMRQLDAQNIFVLLFALVLGTSFAVKRILEKRSVLPISFVQQSKFFAIKTSVVPTLLHGCSWTWHVFKYTYLFFIVFNGVVYTYLARFLGLYFKMLDTPVVGFRWFNVHLFYHMMIVGSSASCLWETVDRVYNIYFAVPEPITRRYKNQFDCLVAGLQAKNSKLLQALAYAELAFLSSKSTDRRAELYRDIGNNQANASAWSRISSECISTINALTATLEAEYKGPQNVKEPEKTTKPAEPLAFDKITLIDKDVFASKKRPLTMLDDRTCRVFADLSSPLVEETDELPPPSDAETIVNIAAAPVRLVLSVISHLEVRSRRWKQIEQLHQNTLARQTCSLFKDFPLTIWAIQALGNLTAASYREDPYGFVQRDIGPVLDCLLACLVKVDEILRSPPSSYHQLVADGYRNDNLDEPRMVLMALREAIYDITVTFKQHPECFKVQTTYEPRLHRFVEFLE